MRRPVELLLSLVALTLAIVATACNASVGGPAAEGDDCGYGDFVCGDNTCVDRASVCNGTENCADGTDEDDCATRCERNQYRCRDGVTCISQASLCDEREDCPGGDDEATCGTEECAGGFTCPDGTCLPATAKCNGQQECPGGEDESREVCSPARCPNADDLRCADGQTCVPKARQCDGVPHCATGEDEGAAACAGGNADGGDDPDPAGDKEGDTGGDKPNEGGDGPDKPGGGGGGRPCGDVPAEGRCGKSDVLEWCDSGRLERQSCRRQGLVCGRNGDGDAACVAPAGAEPTSDCGGVDAMGECQGNTLVFCVNGTLRTQDCGRSDKICNDTTGAEAKCELPVEDTCGGAPSTGECDGNTLVWCDAAGARQTYDCASSSMTCGATPGGELEFGCQAAPCGDVDYFGTCDGDTLRYCQNGSVLVEVDCQAELGLSCGLQNETVGNNCVAVPDAGGACGAVTFEGECQGDTVVWCNGETLDTYDCGTVGKTCGDYAGVGKWCVEKSGAIDGCGDIDYYGTCQGDVAMWCANGTLRSKDCGDDGKACGLISDSVGYYCTTAPPAETCESRCNVGAVAGSSPACFCDSLCVANGDCCGGVESYQDVCSAPDPAPAATCEGHCGQPAPAPGSSPACYCDDACEANGDCCDDYFGICTSVSV